MNDRATVKVPAKLHRLLKLEATSRNMSVGRLVCEAILVYCRRKHRPTDEHLAVIYRELLERWGLKP